MKQYKRFFTLVIIFVICTEGVDIYAYEEGMSWGYRYGPTMMNYADGSMDAWFAAPGAAGPWD